MKTLEKNFNELWNEENIKDLENLLTNLKSEIDDDMKDDDESNPYIQITIGMNEECTDWNYQSGDNSFTGNCYSYPHWSVSSLTRDCNVQILAKDLIQQLSELY